ncbi:hypothetical protein Nepgr_003516 [Nepenthes gracilis]|uniref:Uncharacterized protein n=1 Tax=Nepenthes gracilis TaxID=150966 RepID=A0AAD3XDS4_NEPGR|nr:hypothetical protein Nepgr_003516 [Nepenthes gracilis]
MKELERPDCAFAEIGKDECVEATTDAKRAYGLDFNANDYKMIGVSDEQLDVFNEDWYTSSLKTGNATMAVDIMEKQLKIREGIPLLWHMLEKAYLMLGRQEAASAAEKAVLLEYAYFESTNVAASAFSITSSDNLVPRMSCMVFTRF